MEETYTLRDHMTEYMNRVSELLGVLAAAVSASGAAVTAYTMGQRKADDIQRDGLAKAALKAGKDLDDVVVAAIIRLQQMPTGPEEKQAVELYGQALLAFRRPVATYAAWGASLQSEIDSFATIGDWLDARADSSGNAARQALVDRFEREMSEAAAQYELAADALPGAPSPGDE